MSSPYASENAQLRQRLQQMEEYVRSMRAEVSGLAATNASLQQQLREESAKEQAVMDLAGRDAAASDREHLTCLIQLQQISDEDLIRRAADIQSTQNDAPQDSLERNNNATLEQQLMEAQFFRSGLQRSQSLVFLHQVF